MKKDRQTQKIERIHQLLQEKLTDQNQESVYLMFDDLENEPLLRDRDGLEKTLTLISTKTDGRISWRETTDRSSKGMVGGSGGAGAADRFFAGPVTRAIIGVVIHVDDPAKLDYYFNQLQTQDLAHRASKDVIIRDEITTGKLRACADGLIRYEDKVVRLRGQLITLCWLFMEHHKILITTDEIKKQVIESKKRENTRTDTISKYVNELHTALKEFFGHEVIFNTKKDGWTLDVDRQK